jgi:hypothetical protein
MVSYAEANVGEDWETYDAYYRQPQGADWCAYFAANAMRKAGSGIAPSSYGNVANFTVAVPGTWQNGVDPGETSNAYFKYYPKKSILEGKVTIQPGDLAIWNWDNYGSNYSRSHINIVVEAGDTCRMMDGTCVPWFTMIGGNQGSSNPSLSKVTKVPSIISLETGGERYTYGNLVGIVRPTGA